MKKLGMFLVGTMMVLSLAACTPTTEKQQQDAAKSVEELSTGGAFDKVPDPEAPELEIISIYHSNEDVTGLMKAMDGVETMDAQAVVDKLIEYGVLEEGTEVLSFETQGEKTENAGPGGSSEGDSVSSAELGILDLSKVPSNLGTSGELAMLTAIGNTFTENFNLDQLKLLVNGENYESGHIVHADEDYLTYEPEYEKLGQ